MQVLAAAAAVLQAGIGECQTGNFKLNWARPLKIATDVRTLNSTVTCGFDEMRFPEFESLFGTPDAVLKYPCH